MGFAVSPYTRVLLWLPLEITVITVVQSLQLFSYYSCTVITVVRLLQLYGHYSCTVIVGLYAAPPLAAMTVLVNTNSKEWT